MKKIFKRLFVFTLGIMMFIPFVKVNAANPYTIESGDLDTVGSVVKIGNEEFYVIGKEDSTHIKLFAKYNLLVGNGITSPTNKQDSSALGFNSITGSPYPATVPFVDSTDSIGYWMELKGENLLYLKSAYGTDVPAYVYDDNATIKTYVDSYVTYLNSLGVNVEGRLIGKDELLSLGCSETKCSDSSYDWLTTSSYWTGTAVESEMLAVVYTNGELNKNYFGNKGNFGVRPVIILSTSVQETKYKVSFNSNGGTGTMADVSELTGTYTLPANGFTAPNGKQFKGWSLSSNGEIITQLDMTENKTVYAIWEDIPSVSYTIEEGNNQTFKLNDTTDIVIKANGDLTKLTGIKVDGTTLASSNYTTASGSTILTLLNSYLKTLSAGNHTVTFVYDDGSVDATLVVAESTNSNTGDDSNTSTDTNNTTDNNSNTTTNDSDNPQTGDNIYVNIIMLIISLTGLAGGCVYLGKNRLAKNN